MPKFEVAFYNKQVREKVENREHHAHYTDDWADFRYVDIRAENEDQARARIKDRYPSKNGFVIDSVIKVE